MDRAQRRAKHAEPSKPSKRPKPWFALSLASAAAVVATSVLGAAGGCTPVVLPDGERRSTLGALATNVIVPTFSDLVARTEDLRISAANFAASPTPDVWEVAARAWREARVPWKESEAFAFGPVNDVRLGAALDQSPVEPTQIEAEIAGNAQLTASYVASLGANRKGFHAIEILLFVPPTSAGVIASFAADDVQGARRRAFLIALTENLVETAGAVRDAWDPDAGGYATRFSKPGGADAAFPTVQAALNVAIAEAVFLTEKVALFRLGRPLGLETGGTPRAALQESGPSDNSLADMEANLRSVRNFYLGSRDGSDGGAGSDGGVGGGGGLSALVAKKNGRIDVSARAALQQALAAVAAVPRPFASALVDNRDAVESAYFAVRELKAVLATEVLGVLGATLGSNPNDGD